MRPSAPRCCRSNSIRAKADAGRNKRVERPCSFPDAASTPPIPTTKETIVNKSELIEHIAKNADISKAKATRALDATMGAIKQEVN